MQLQQCFATGGMRVQVDLATRKSSAAHVGKGHERRFRDIRVMSATASTAAEKRTLWEVRVGPIPLKKSEVK